jgi:predicted ABC-type ATPase
VEGPEMIIVGGANGSGKTTFASRYHQAIGAEFLNADNIASELKQRGVANAMIAAGRVFFRRLEELIAARKTFVVETTLSGSYMNKVAKRAKGHGFQVVTIFIYLDSPIQCVQRVAMRVKKGGHSVPRTDIIRRYERANQNFRSFFQSYSDQWYLYYNGMDNFQLVAAHRNASINVELPLQYSKFQKL